MTLNKNTILIMGLIGIGFVLRLISSMTIPMVEDEGVKILLSNDISFNLNSFKLPIGHELIPHSLFSLYLVKLGFLVFNPSLFSARIFFVLCGTISLLFIYRLVNNQFGSRTALFTLILLVFDQFHIGESSQIREEAPLMLFSSMAIYFFFKTLNEKRNYMYLTAIVIGLGYLCKEIIVTIPIAFVLFLYIRKKDYFRENAKQILISTLLFLLVISPYTLWSIKNNFLHYNSEHFTFGFSFRVIYLYFGEILMSLNKLNLISLTNVVSNEYPFVHWVFSISVIYSILFALKKENIREELISYCLIMFTSIVLVTTFIDSAILDSHWRASLTIYPSIILTAYMGDKFSQRKKTTKVITYLAILYFIVHSLIYIKTPMIYDQNYYVDQAQEFLNNSH